MNGQSILEHHEASKGSKRLKVLPCVFTFILFFQTEHTLSATVEVVAPMLPSLLDGNAYSPYNLLLDAISIDSKIDFQLTVLPPMRAIQDFNQGKYDMYYAGDISLAKIPSLESLPFNKLKILLFSAPETTPLRSLNEIRNLRVSRVRGIRYPMSIENLLTRSTIITNSENQNIRMLLSGRVDAFFGLVPDVYLSAQELRLHSTLSFDSSISYLQLNDGFLVAQNKGKKRNNQLLKRINLSIGRLKASGEIERILGIAYVE